MSILDADTDFQLGIGGTCAEIQRRLDTQVIRVWANAFDVIAGHCHLDARQGRTAFLQQS
ncbi:hypothetical protein EAO75_43955 [Streptomyces sp. uw30]|nr:hypothetical protein EAO75_43955 [Streptomyces sp. uw30]